MKGPAVPVTSPTVRRALVVLAVLTALFGWSGIAYAHTELESTEPADGAVMDAPVTEIVVIFTLPVTIVGNGFELLDPSGEVVQPDVATDDNTVFILTLDEPLSGGVVAVRYEVAAEDGHVLAEGFSFTVEGATTTTTSPPPTSMVPEATTTRPPVATTVPTTTTSVPADEPSGPVLPWLVGVGVVVLAGVGIYAGVRSRTNK